MAMALETEKAKQLMAALESKDGVERVAEIKPLLYARILEDALQLRPEPKQKQAQQAQADAKADQREEKAESADWDQFLNQMVTYLKQMVPNFRPEMLNGSRGSAGINVRAMQVMLLTVVANLRLTHMQPLTRQMEEGYGGFSSGILPPWMQTKPSYAGG